jgi:2-keto-4-pentenoate hydratase
VFTDHQPLIGALARATELKSDCHRQHLSFIAEFTADIRHVAGPDNVVADTLSRPPPLNSGPQAGSTAGVAAAGLPLPLYTAVATGKQAAPTGVTAEQGRVVSAGSTTGVAAATLPQANMPASQRLISET